MFSLPKALEILERTPKILHAWLDGLSEEWTMTNEGEGTWSAFDVVGHLIFGDHTDWIPRAKVILSDKTDKIFEPFDRFAQIGINKGKTLPALLQEFSQVRQETLAQFHALGITEADLPKKGLHPTFGEVTLEQLLATWVAHDLNHIAQIARIMAKQYQTEVGPWVAFLRILQ